MKKTIVRYKVKSERADENIAYIQNVFQALAENAPSGVRYAAFQMDDGLSFVHVVSIETNDGSNPLTSLQAFENFTKDIASRCDDPPKAMEATTIGDYGVFG